MRAYAAGLLLLLGVSCAVAAVPTTRQEHRAHLQQAKVVYASLVCGFGSERVLERVLWLTASSTVTGRS